MKMLWKIVKMILLAWFLIVAIGAAVMVFKPLQSLDLVDKVELGMSRERLLYEVKLPPSVEAATFYGCTQPEGRWTGDCKALLNSGAAKFIVWKFGMDTVLVVGLDASDKVVFRGLGDT